MLIPSTSGGFEVDFADGPENTTSTAAQRSSGTARTARMATSLAEAMATAFNDFSVAAAVTPHDLWLFAVRGE